MTEKDEMVRIVSYDPSWPVRFEEERRLIVSALGAWVMGDVHHVGSTAVPGLAAKPTIDILVGTKDLASAAPCVGLLGTIGYHHRPVSAVRLWFYKPTLSHRTYHLHLVEYAGTEWDSHLAFRDALRAHPETAAHYEALKRRLAETHRNDREAYTNGKASFIRSVLGSERSPPCSS